MDSSSSSSSEQQQQKIKLRSSDGEEFEVDKAVAMQSQTIADVIECGFPMTVIPLPVITSQVLSKVILYCEKHAAAAPASNTELAAYEDELKAWDANFLLDHSDIIFDLVLAADFLYIRSLLDLSCDEIVEMVRRHRITRNINLENVEEDLWRRALALRVTLARLFQNHLATYN